MYYNLKRVVYCQNGAIDSLASRVLSHINKYAKAHGRRHKFMLICRLEGKKTVFIFITSEDNSVGENICTGRVLSRRGNGKIL